MANPVAEIAAMPLCHSCKLAQRVNHGRRSGDDGFIVQKTFYIGRQSVGRFVTAGAVLFQGLHHDPVQIALDQSERSFCGFVWRCDEIVVAVSPRLLRRVLGLGGSSSRMIFRN